MSLVAACKAVVLPIVSVADLTDLPTEVGQRGGGRAKYYLAYTVNLILMVVAGYLAWNCNVGETVFMRSIYTLLAVIFSGLYLLYYFVYRILMGKSCGITAELNSLRT